MTVGELIAELKAEGFNDAQIVTVVTLASRYASRAERDGRSPEAERARRYRLAKSAKTTAAKANDVAASVVTTVTDGAQNALIYKKESDSQLSTEKKRKKESDSVNGRARGHPLPAGALIPPKFLQCAIDEGATDRQSHQWWAEFVDYWSDIPGQRGCKVSWLGTWRNRVRFHLGKGAQHGKSQKTSNTELAYELAEQFEREADFRRAID